MIKKLFPILGITFIDIVGFSMLLPLLPYFVVHFPGTSAFAVGVLASTFSICSFISGPIWGNVSDRIGRKAVLIISQIGATFGWVMLAFAPNMFVVFIARIIEGSSGGNIGVTQAYVADLCEPQERSKAFGYIMATFSAAMVFGPAGGGFLYAKYGFAAPFLTAAALQLLTLIVTIIFLPESRSKQDEEEAHVGYREIFASLKNPRLSPILVQKLALSLALYGWYVAIALYLKGQLGFGLVQTTQFFSAFAIVNVVVNAFGVGRASKSFGDARMAVIGLALLVGAFGCTPFVHTALGFAGMMALFSLGGAFAQNGINALISNAATSREQGTVLGVGSSLDSLSGIVAPPISTGVLTLYGSAYAGLASLVFAAISLLLGIRNASAGPGVSVAEINDAPTPLLKESS